MYIHAHYVHVYNHTSAVYNQKTQFAARGVRDEVQQTQQDTREGTSSAIG